MENLRIVRNRRTGQYRVERRRLWDWAMVMNDTGDAYLAFDSFEAARRYVTARNTPRAIAARRWQVAQPCCD
jgi:hypothetical protein